MRDVRRMYVCVFIICRSNGKRIDSLIRPLCIQHLIWIRFVRTGTGYVTANILHDRPMKDATPTRTRARAHKYHPRCSAIRQSTADRAAVQTSALLLT